MDGDVSIRRGDSGDFIAAAINAPLVVTDRLVTGPASRAELQFDWSNMIRIGSNAEVRLADLDNGRYQIQVAIGTTTFRVLRDSNAQVEISTPSVAVRPLGRGVYRVTVLEDGSSEITVRLGEAEIYTPRGAERLRAGGTMRARGSASDPEFMDAFRREHVQRRYRGEWRHAHGQQLQRQWHRLGQRDGEHRGHSGRHGRHRRRDHDQLRRHHRARPTRRPPLHQLLDDRASRSDSAGGPPAARRLGLRL